METRNILDVNGNIVGTVSLPDGTSEAQWAVVLAAYSTTKPIPDVTPRQIRQALILSGVSLSSIDSAIAGLPSPMNDLAAAEWEYSIAFERNRPLVIEVATMLGWTSAQLDALWILAGSL